MRKVARIFFRRTRATFRLQRPPRVTPTYIIMKNLKGLLYYQVAFITILTRMHGVRRGIDENYADARHFGFHHWLYRSRSICWLESRRLFCLHSYIHAPLPHPICYLRLSAKAAASINLKCSQAYMEDHLTNKARLDTEWAALCAYDADPCSVAIAQQVSANKQIFSVTYRFVAQHH